MIKELCRLSPSFANDIRRSDEELRETYTRAVQRIFTAFETILPDDTTHEDVHTAMSVLIENRAIEFAYTHHGAWRLLPTGERRDVLGQLEDRLVMDATTVLIGLGLTRKEAI